MKRKQLLCVLLVSILCTFIFAANTQAKELVGSVASFVGRIINGDHFDEGTNTPIEILEYMPYEGEKPDMFLKKGDSIAVISPSALPTAKDAQAVMQGLKDWGYVPVAGKHILEEGRSLEDCVEDLMWALEDPEIKAIFCIRGGYGANEVMDEIPLELLKNSEKLIIGFSDITVFHSAYSSVGLLSMHACMSMTFKNLAEECKAVEERIIRGEIPVYRCKSSDRCIPGEAEGKLIGGNLSTFAALLETAYDCTKSGESYILFLEDVDEDYSQVHRLLTILKNHGVLDKASGIIFGEWTDVPIGSNDYSGSSRNGDFSSMQDMISRRFLENTRIPVAFGFPAGHGNVNYPLLMGEKVKLTVDRDNYELEWIY